MSSPMIRLAGNILVFSLIFLACSGAMGFESGELNRPSNVPKEFIITPNGYFHPSCVMALEPGDVVDAEKNWVTRQGYPTKSLQCDYSHYDADGKEIQATVRGGSATPAAECPVPNGPCPGAGGNPPSSWVIWDSIFLASPVELYWQTMIVPNAPAVVSGQIIYFFPGLQQQEGSSSDSYLTILQPVLAWSGVWVLNGISYGYQNQWEMASWNCCYQGVEVFSTPVVVSPGDIVLGEMSGNDCNVTTGVCSTWNVGMEDQITLKSTQLTATKTYGQYYQEMFGGVLEVYGLGSCNEFPSNSTLFGENNNTYEYGPPFAFRYVGKDPVWNYSPPGGSWPATTNPHTNAPSCGYSSVPVPNSGGAFYFTY